MLYVFGKTLICRNMEVATSFARKHGLDCITLGMVINYSGQENEITRGKLYPVYLKNYNQK